MRGRKPDLKKSLVTAQAIDSDLRCPDHLSGAARAHFHVLVGDLQKSGVPLSHADVHIVALASELHAAMESARSAAGGLDDQGNWRKWRDASDRYASALLKVGGSPTERLRYPITARPRTVEGNSDDSLASWATFKPLPRRAST